MSKTEQQAALVSVDAFDEKYPIDQFNPLLPSKTIVESVQRYSKLTVEIVKINSDVKAQEVYSLGKVNVNGDWVDKLSLTKTALDKLRYAMSIEAVPEKSGRQDDRSDRDYFEYVAVGRITKPDGSKVEFTATKVIDVRVFVEEIFEKLTEQHEAGNLGEWKGTGTQRKLVKYTDEEARKHIEQKCRTREIELRKHGLALAETGAQNRLVRQITNLKPWYTKEELERPFVVARIDRNVEDLAANPKTRAEVMRQGSHAADLTFPGSASGGAMPEIQDAVFTDLELGAASESDEAKITPAELRKEFEEQCQEMDITHRFRQMESLIELRQIKAEGTDELLTIEFANWEKRNDIEQVKNLMWAFDQPKPDGLPH